MSEDDDEDKEVELTLDYVTETDKAYKLSDGTNEKWVAKSQVQATGADTYIVPMWIAKENGWV
jgi:hypothetical protein